MKRHRFNWIRLTNSLNFIVEHLTSIIKWIFLTSDGASSREAEFDTCNWITNIWKMEHSGNNDPVSGCFSKLGR